MRRLPLCGRPQTELFTLAKLFVQSDCRHLPVVEAQCLLDGQPPCDVLRALVGHSREWALRDPDAHPDTRGIPDVAGVFAARHLVE
jgi:hypothetical protein